MNHPVYLGVVGSERCGLDVILGLHIAMELPSFINRRQFKTCVGLRIYEQYGNLSITRQTPCNKGLYSKHIPASSLGDYVFEFLT